MDFASRWSGTLMDNYGSPVISVASAHGSTLVTEDGRELIDMLGGIAVTSLGHCHPRVVDAITHQASTLIHCSNLYASRPVVELGQALIERFCANGLVDKDSTRVFFCNSGAEANEAAFKLSRLTGRRRILAANHGFHGRLMGSLAMTGQPAKRDIFSPLPGGVEFYPFGDIDYLTKLVEINPTDVASIILEPIQGETGVIPAPEGFIAAVRRLCDEHGILMIVDEVQTGIGRTGTFFAHSIDGVAPDVVTMAKGLGGGMPIGACLAHGRAARLFTPGSHGTTFGGNPVCCAAGLAVLSVIDDDFCADVQRKGELLSSLLSDIDGIDHVRGRGLMLGAVTTRPIAKKAVALGYDRGVVLNAPNDSVIRLTPPLVITDEEIKTAVDRLAQSLSAAASEQ